MSKITIDVEKERVRLQAIFDGPNSTALDRALFDDVIGKGSAPSEWSPETRQSAYLMCRIYIMGWEGATRAAKEAA